nr:hypothetical protein [Mycobacterium sp. 1274761.0]
MTGRSNINSSCVCISASDTFTHISWQSLDQFKSTGIPGVKTAADPTEVVSVLPSRHAIVGDTLQRGLDEVRRHFVSGDGDLRTEAKVTCRQHRQSLSPDRMSAASSVSPLSIGGEVLKVTSLIDTATAQPPGRGSAMPLLPRGG